MIGKREAQGRKTRRRWLRATVSWSPCFIPLLSCSMSRILYGGIVIGYSIWCHFHIRIWPGTNRHKGPRSIFYTFINTNSTCLDLLRFACLLFWSSLVSPFCWMIPPLVINCTRNGQCYLGRKCHVYESPTAASMKTSRPRFTTTNQLHFSHFSFLIISVEEFRWHLFWWMDLMMNVTFCFHFVFFFSFLFLSQFA